jgi:hypothetical protein
MAKKRFSKKVADYISKSLLKMSYDELVQIRSEVGWLSASNCWWVEYHLRDILIELLDVDIKNKQKEIADEKQILS